MNLSRMSAKLMRVTGAAVLTAAALVGGAQGIANAAPDAPGDRKVYGLFKNHTMRKLTLVPGQTRIIEGWWMTKPKTIGPLKVVRWGSTSKADQGGTSAVAVFQTTSGQVRVYWNNPWMLDNDIRCDAPSDLRCTVDYDLGARPVATFDLYED